MKRNLMEITNNFRQKRIDSIISHDGKLVSWLHQMTSLNKLLLGKVELKSVTTKSGGRKTRRKKEENKETRKKEENKETRKKRKKTRGRKK